MSSIDEAWATAWGVFAYIWVISENPGTPRYVEVGKCVKLALINKGTSTTEFNLYLYDTDDIQYDESVDLDVGSPYYLTITRMGDRIICEIFSDSGRTTLVDTLTITIEPADDIVFSTMIVTASPKYFAGTAGQTDGYVEDLEIVRLGKAVAGSIRVGMDYRSR